MRWRIALGLLGSFFLALSAGAGWLVVCGPGVFTRLHAVVHLALFGAMGAVMAATAVRSADGGAKELLVAFLGDVFGRRNLRELTVWAAVIGVALLILVAMHRR